MKFIHTLRNAFKGTPPLSILSTPKKPKPKSIAGLYVMHVDFPITPELKKSLDEQLEPLRQKFGLDFLVLEPGITLTRFDDI